MLVPQKSPFRSRWFILLSVVTSTVGAFAVTVFARQQWAPTGAKTVEVANSVQQQMQRVVVSMDPSLPPVYWGGFCHALVAGSYAQAGLAVTLSLATLQPSGPQFLLAGASDYHLGKALDAFVAAQKGLKVKAIAAFVEENAKVNGQESGAVADKLPYFVYAAVVLATQKTLDDNKQISEIFLRESAKAWQGYFANPSLAHKCLMERFPKYSEADLQKMFDKIRTSTLNKSSLGSEDTQAVVNFGVTTNEGWARTFTKLSKEFDLNGDYNPTDAFTLDFNPVLTP